MKHKLKFELKIIKRKMDEGYNSFSALCTACDETCSIPWSPAQSLKDEQLEIVIEEIIGYFEHKSCGETDSELLKRAMDEDVSVHYLIMEANHSLEQLAYEKSNGKTHRLECKKEINDTNDQVILNAKCLDCNKEWSITTNYYIELSCFLPFGLKKEDEPDLMENAKDEAGKFAFEILTKIIERTSKWCLKNETT